MNFAGSWYHIYILWPLSDEMRKNIIGNRLGCENDFRSHVYCVVSHVSWQWHAAPPDRHYKLLVAAQWAALGREHLSLLIHPFLSAFTQVWWREEDPQKTTAASPAESNN